jgi:serine/threonine protein kinase
MNTELDALCEEFVAALKRGEAPVIREWAKTDTAIPKLALLELGHRLAAGEIVTASDYFEQYPVIYFHREAAIQLIGVEYRAAVSRDPYISETQFRERYPDLANAQEWSNGPWVNNSPTGEFSPSTQELAAPPENASKVKLDLPTFLVDILSAPFAEHPSDLGRLGDYRVLDVLAYGGMGAVLKGENVHSRRPAAIKVMLPTEVPKAYDRFLREAEAAQAIDHPRVVPIYHVGKENGVPYIAMKLLQGRSLQDRLRHRPSLKPSEIVRIAKEIAEGLEAAHEKGLIHRDLKPGNIWLEAGSEGDRVRILDFGLAKAICESTDEEGSNLTTRNVIMGTPAYMSPEQTEAKDLDARTDLWSLGVIIYRLAANKLPFGDESIFKMLKAIATDTPKPLHEINPNLPPGLSTLVAELLEKDSEKRPRDASEVIKKLQQIENWEAPTTKIEYVAPKAAPSILRKWIPIAVGTLVVLATVGVLALSPPREQTITTPNLGKTETITAVTADQPLKVKAFSIQHYANRTPEKPVPEVEARGILGKESFEATFGDVLKVEVELTCPAYCYIVAFRPDGVAECIYPEPAAADQPPEFTDYPRYPSKSRGDYYGLTDGTGLWVFGVIASQKPLPAFTKAIAGKTIPKFAGGKLSANTVFWDDGKWIETLTKLGSDRGTRGAGAKVQGTSNVTDAVDWLKQLTDDPDAVSAAIGFGVQPRN